MAIRIGIRELRQHASQYLRRVRAGETITLTDRGEPFAEIRPIPTHTGILDRMIAEGRARPPKTDLAALLAQPAKPAPKDNPRALSDEVIRSRADERY